MAGPHILGLKPDCSFMVSMSARQSCCLCLSSTVFTKSDTLTVVSVVFALVLAITYFLRGNIPHKYTQLNLSLSHIGLCLPNRILSSLMLGESLAYATKAN